MNSDHIRITEIMVSSVHIQTTEIVVNSFVFQMVSSLPDDNLKNNCFAIFSSPLCLRMALLSAVYHLPYLRPGSSFHNCGDPVKLVQACLSACKYLESTVDVR